MQVRKISQWSVPISAKWPLIKSKTFAALFPFWHLWTLSSPSSFTLMPVELALGQFYTMTFMVKNVWLGMAATPWTKERAATWWTNWNFWVWSGLSWQCFMNISSAMSSQSSPIITPWLTSWQWLNWMKWAIAGWLSWPCMISQCCTSQVRPS